MRFGRLDNLNGNYKTDGTDYVNVRLGWSRAAESGDMKCPDRRRVRLHRFNGWYSGRLTSGRKGRATG